MKRVVAFVVAVAAAYVLAVVMYTQLNLSSIVELGLDVTLGDRMSAALHDLGGMAVLYLPLMTITLLLGFSVAGLVLRWVPQLDTLGYVVGGFTAVLVFDTLLTAATTTHPLAVTRTFVGLMSQCVAGAVGGWVYATVMRRNQAVSDS